MDEGQNIEKEEQKPAIMRAKGGECLWASLPSLSIRSEVNERGVFVVFSFRVLVSRLSSALLSPSLLFSTLFVARDENENMLSTRCNREAFSLAAIPIDE